MLEITTAQITALIDIYIIISDLGVRKEVSSKVPPMGVRITGLSAATPITPYFLQIVTNLRLRIVNLLRFLKSLSSIRSLRNVPRYVNNVTLDIMPSIVTTMVVSNEKPAAYPPTGPAINLSMVNKNIEKNLISSSPIEH